MLFNDFNLNSSILYGLKKMKIHTPTPIQEQSIPAILENDSSHLIAQARTGSGKTLAFAIPIVQTLDPKLFAVQCVIILPTRELCKQVAEVFQDITKTDQLNVVQVYGGVSIDRQIQKIRDGAQIVVATPGRLMDLFNRRRISFEAVKFVVLDEADRMLDMGFIPDIEFLLLDAMRNVQPRLMLFSATMFGQIMDLTKRFTQGKNVVEINVSEDQLTVANCEQYYYLMEFRDKYYHFVRILKKERPKHSMIFVNTKKTGDWLYDRLQNESGLNLVTELISGNLTQRRRETVLSKFRKKQINCLIATDVAARGLDIDKVSHVFNYDLPDFEENYVHRIGRTARVYGESGKVEKGIAISLVLTDQLRLLARIEGYMEKDIKQRPLPPRGSNSRRTNTHPRASNPNFRNPRTPGQNAQGTGSRPRSYSRTSQRSPKKKSKSPDRRNFLY